MKFLQETGLILGKNNEILHFVDGSSSSVEFPSELILELHRLSPGIVQCISHVHPPLMSQMSSRDKLTLQTLAKTLHPFPIYLEVIAEMVAGEPKDTPYTNFSITPWFAQLESKESYENRKKETPRIVTIKQMPPEEVVFFPNVPRNEYWDILIRSSYLI